MYMKRKNVPIEFYNNILLYVFVGAFGIKLGREGTIGEENESKQRKQNICKNIPISKKFRETELRG